MAYNAIYESFDAGDLSKWELALYGAIAASVGRRGTSALRFLKNFAAEGAFERVTKPFTPSAHITVGVAINVVSAPEVTTYVQLRNGSTAIATFYISSSGGLSADANGILTSLTTISKNAWNYFEIGLNISDSGSFEVRMNGSLTPVIVGNPRDTKPGTVGTVDRVAIGFVNSYWLQADILFDDIYIHYGDELNYLRYWRIDNLALTGNATPQDWTPDTGNAWERLNATAGNISANAVDSKSLFELATISHAVLDVYGVQVNAIANTADSGPRTVAAVVKSGSTESIGTATAVAVSDTTLAHSLLVDPNTGLPWTVSAIDALQAGVKIIS